jgi:hypothetical protein
MTHEVDGLVLKYTARTSWKAEVRARGGRLLGVVPVCWTNGMRREGGETYLQVWYQKPAEMEKQRKSKKPFLVATALAKSYSQLPRQFQEFRGVFEVRSTGKALDHESIETVVIRRVNGRNIDDA